MRNIFYMQGGAIMRNPIRDHRSRRDHSFLSQEDRKTETYFSAENDWQKESFSATFRDRRVRYAASLLVVACLIGGIHLMTPIITAYASVQKASQNQEVQTAASDLKINTNQTYVPAFRATPSSVSDHLSSSADNLLLQKDQQIGVDSCGLYIDGNFVGAVKEESELQKLLQNLLDSAKGDGEDATSTFLSDVRCIPGTYPASSVLTDETMKALLLSKQTVQMDYQVQNNENAQEIANKNGLTVETLSQKNPDVDLTSLKSGDTIKLSQEKPLISIQSVCAKQETEEIPYDTVQKDSDTLYKGQTSVETEGENGQRQVTYCITSVNGKETNKEAIHTDVLKDAVSKVILNGTKDCPAGMATGTFEWPTPTMHTITTGFEYRWGKFHPGIDISDGNAFGSQIVAADGGTVTKASDTGDGYGNCVMIDHGNGYVTLYGHASQLLVSVGQKVQKGQLIALVGSTGYSTGPHCHFEVIHNGTKENPFSYVSQ